ncbi:MAG: DUF3987 domain-containing protein, partial [Halobacteriovoraceae bacterium]|nr:DUF3987 domain-containing protein [Halobacteriovoraceae bacterium]
VASYKKLLKLQKNLEKQEGSKLPIESDIELLKKDVKELEETLEAKPLKYKTLIVSDITSGAFLQRASRTNENILFFQDELSGLLISLKNHFKSDLRPVFLQGWNGTGEYYKETKTDGIEFIKLLSVSILGSIQPTVISPILDEIFSGRNDDGFTQRFQFLVYPDFTDEIPSNGFYNQEYLHELQSAVESLLDYYSIITNQCKKTIILTDKALELSSKLCNFTFDDSLDEMSKQIIKSFTSKSPKLLYSIALIFEILENHENLENLNKISDNSLETSYRLCLKLFEYLRKFLFYKLYPEKTKSHLIINRIIAGDIYDQMKVRDLKRKEWRGLRTYDDINMALSELEAQNWLRITEVSSISGVGRKSDIIELNPYLSNTDIKNYIEG